MIKAVIFDFNGVFVGAGWRGEAIDNEMLTLTRELRDLGLKLFVLSNSSRGQAEYYRQSFSSLIQIFNKCYFSGETGLIKPDPEAFELLLQENNLEASDCAYFDDSSYQVVAARKLGFQAYQYEGPTQVRSILSQLRVPFFSN